MTAQSDFAARGTRDVQAAQEALSGQMMRQACQDDGNTPLGALTSQEGHGELERYTTRGDCSADVGIKEMTLF